MVATRTRADAGRVRRQEPEPTTVGWRCAGLTFEGLYREYSGGVHGMAARLGGPGIAEDVTQEVFLRLWHAPQRYDANRGSVRAYLAVATRHATVDRMRSDGARRTREYREAHLGTVPPAGVTEDLVRRETTTAVLAALDSIRSEDREAIVTAVYGYLSYREAAIVLGLPEGTLKSRVRRGLKALACLLDPGPSESEAAGGRWGMVGAGNGGTA